VGCNKGNLKKKWGAAQYPVDLIKSAGEVWAVVAKATMRPTQRCYVRVRMEYENDEPAVPRDSRIASDGQAAAKIPLEGLG
jgi:hypothetical protein